MFRKKYEYEDERRPMPVIWTIIIALAFVFGAYAGACYLTGIAEQHEIARQYGE